MMRVPVTAETNMPSSTLRVVAHFRARSDTIEELKSLLAGLVAPTRAEDGCIRYELHQDNEDPLRVTFIEEWSDDAALDAHLASAHVQAALAQAPDLLDADPDIRRCTMIA